MKNRRILLIAFVWATPIILLLSGFKDWWTILLVSILTYFFLMKEGKKISQPLIKALKKRKEKKEGTESSEDKKADEEGLEEMKVVVGIIIFFLSLISILCFVALAILEAGSVGSIIVLIAAGFVFLWSLSSFFVLEMNEWGIVSAFGRPLYKCNSGLHYFIRFPRVKINRLPKKRFELDYPTRIAISKAGEAHTIFL